jgi:hypothetical protein
MPAQQRDERPRVLSHRFRLHKVSIGACTPNDRFAGKVTTGPSHHCICDPGQENCLRLFGELVVSGFAAQAGTPGPYGVNSLAKVIADRRSHADTSGQTIIDEAWEAKTADGSTVEMQIQFTRGEQSRVKTEGLFYSAAKPEFY